MIRDPLTAGQARPLEWETVVGLIGFTAEDIQRSVNERNYALFDLSVSDLRVLLDEISERMTKETSS